jgi:hypothetical protein
LRDFGGSDYCASLRGPERDSLSKTIVTIIEFGYLKDFMKRRAKITRKRCKKLGG